ncbi:MAG: hypothetical protein U1E15_08865 [Hyphomicrobiales bacterium]
MSAGQGPPIPARLAFRTTVTAKKLLDKRPGWGMVTFLSEGLNAAGELAMSFEGRVLVQCRSHPLA